MGVGEASSAEEADQQSSERSVATLLTGTGPSWELHGPRVARRLRHRTRCHNIRQTCITAAHSSLHCLLSCFCSFISTPVCSPCKPSLTWWISDSSQNMCVGVPVYVCVTALLV